MVDVTLGMPGTSPSRYAVPASLEVTVDGQPFRLSLVEAGLACCAVEVAAALSRSTSVVDLPALEVLLVSGTVTDVLAPAVRAMWEALRETGTTYVLSFGACANSGGPYWDSYAVTNGIDQLIPVDVYVPGCPPRPEALLEGLRRLRELTELAS